MWTGDNLGTWEHMAVGIKMVLANGIAGLSFAGCKCKVSPITHVEPALILCFAS